MTLLSIKDLSVTYHSGGKRVRAVDKFSLDIEQGESWGIVGESGSGKTSLIMAFLRLLPKDITEVEGEVYLDGVELMGLTEKELSKLRWQELSLVFQKDRKSVV